MSRQISLIKTVLLASLACALIAGCSSPGNSIAPNTSSPTVITLTSTIEPSKTFTKTSTPAPTATVTSTPIPTDTATLPEPSPMSTETMSEVQSEVKVPILLYHHINGDASASRYHVSLPNFQSQMEALYEMGYQSISLSQFLDALDRGTPLPEKSVLITFDDGHKSVYDNAFPIMKALGFTGVFYIVANRIYDIPDFVNISTLKEMINAGWEIGSRSYTHSDLTKNHTIAYQEIASSKIDLEKALQTEVKTFAYPYGTFDPYLGLKVQQYGYQAGMGLGTSQRHTQYTKFYLSRLEIYGDISLTEFKEIFYGD